MTYTIETPSYNERRYGRPWIAEVSGKDFRWGEFQGRNGEAGVLSIEAHPGALIAEGQKDIRKGRGGVDRYYLAMPNGCLWYGLLSTEAEAKRWAKAGWKAYAEHRLTHDVESGVRYACARMLGVQCPLDAIAADAFGLTTAPAKPTPSVSMDAFGL